MKFSRINTREIRPAYQAVSLTGPARLPYVKQALNKIINKSLACIAIVFIRITGNMHGCILTQISDNADEILPKIDFPLCFCFKKSRSHLEYYTHRTYTKYLTVLNAVFVSNIHN
jgi:hypothetical protein